jgi:DNA-binding transcriptional LysR family regulator
MRLTLRQLHIFVAVADYGSTTAAAHGIALSQSAASAALNELEDLLGTCLFDRIGKRLLINDNGRLLLPQARQMLDAAATIEQQFGTPQAGTAAGLYIGSTTTIGTYVLPHILASFAQQNAQGVPRVMIANTADIASAVANFVVDAGMIEGPCHEPDLIVESWRIDEMIIVCAPNHPLIQGAAHAKVTQKQLRDAAWLLREPGSGTREAVEHALLPHLHVLRAGGEFSNSEAIKHAAAAGLGIACLSRLVVIDLMKTGSLVEIKTTLPPLRRHFYLVYNKKKLLSARLAHFLDVCRNWEISA